MYGGATDSLNRRGRTSASPVHGQSSVEQQPATHYSQQPSHQAAAYGQYTPGLYQPPAPDSFASQPHQQLFTAYSTASPLSAAPSAGSHYGSQPPSPYSHSQSQSQSQSQSHSRSQSSGSGYDMSSSSFPTSSFPTDGSYGAREPPSGYTNGHSDFSAQRPYNRSSTAESDTTTQPRSDCTGE